MKIGVAGTGRMGAAIAQRLMNLGHELTVWNRTAEKTQPLAAAGAKVAVTPFQAASFSETVITILTDAAAIDTAYHARDGLLSGSVAGKLFIEMSTVRPGTERGLAGRIRETGEALAAVPPHRARGTRGRRCEHEARHQPAAPGFLAGFRRSAGAVPLAGSGACENRRYLCRHFRGTQRAQQTRRPPRRG